MINMEEIIVQFYVVLYMIIVKDVIEISLVLNAVIKHFMEIIVLLHVLIVLE